MSEWIYQSTAFPSEVQRNNAKIIAEFFQTWNIYAVAAMIGNMSVESYLNPHALRGDISTGAYGLVQWHPPSKLIEWCEDEELDYTDGDSQLQRIYYEEFTETQWTPHSGHPITFEEFATGNWTRADLDYLSDAWCYNYEQPASPDLESRRERSRYFLRIINMLPIWLLFKFKRRLK